VSDIVTEMSEGELAGLSEFSLLAENAEQAGVAGALPDVERVQSDSAEGRISALRWGATTTPPRIVFLHGGGQNAHTWDTVIVGLGEPALAVDLPGHGHSAWRADGDYSPQRNAAALAPVVHELASTADLVVGMSLGGLTALRLAAVAPELVNELVLIDVTPSALQRHAELTAEQQGTVALMHGEREFPSFQAMLDLTSAAASFTIPAGSITAIGPGATTPSAPSPTSPVCGTTSIGYPHPSPWSAAARRASSPMRTPPNSAGAQRISARNTSSRIRVIPFRATNLAR
jgi:esterase